MKKYFGFIVVFLIVILGLVSISFAHDREDKHSLSVPVIPVSSPVTESVSSSPEPFQFWFTSRITTKSETNKKISYGLENKLKTTGQFSSIEHSIMPLVSYWTDFGTISAGYRINIDGPEEKAPTFELSNCIGYFSTKTKVEFINLDNNQDWKLSERIEISTSGPTRFSPYGAIEVLISEGGNTENRYEGGIKTSFNKNWSGNAYYMLDVINAYPISVIGIGIQGSF